MRSNAEVCANMGASGFVWMGAGSAELALKSRTEWKDDVPIAAPAFSLLAGGCGANEAVRFAGQLRFDSKISKCEYMNT